MASDVWRVTCAERWWSGGSRQYQLAGVRHHGSEGGIRFATAVRVRYGSDMSTVQEIEAAADLLPADKKEELLRFLAVRLRKDRAQPQPRIYSAEEVAAMVAEDEADGERFRQGR